MASLSRPFPRSWTETVPTHSNSCFHPPPWNRAVSTRLPSPATSCELVCDLLHAACRPGSAVLTTRGTSRARPPASPLARDCPGGFPRSAVGKSSVNVYDGPCPCFSVLGIDPGESLDEPCFTVGSHQTSAQGWPHHLPFPPAAQRRRLLLGTGRPPGVN